VLSLRTRGKSGIYYIRGSVSLNGQTIDVKEFSTGTSDKDAASHVMAQYEMQLRNELLFGPAAKLVDGVLADAFATYLNKAERPHPSDVLRIGILNRHVGDMSLREVRKAWDHFRREYLSEHALGGQDRYRALFQAAVNSHHALHDIAPCKIQTIKFKNQRVRWLRLDERDRLIESYPAHIQPIILMLAYHGPRTQDALQIQWGVQGVDMVDERIAFNYSKTDSQVYVPQHPRVLEALQPIWEARGKPDSGHVFLNRVGKPFQDTRKARIPGGNPLRASHATACKRAGISNFTIHDWRHHWASHCVMAGIDLITIQKWGGWESLRMVERYAGVGVEHMRDAIAKLK